jgi:hypothetical protein
VMQTQLQDFRAMLEFIVDRIQLRNRLSRHAEFGIAAGRAKLSFEVHAIEDKQPACQKFVTTIVVAFLSRPSSSEGPVGLGSISRYLYSTMQSELAPQTGVRSAWWRTNAEWIDFP